MGQISGSGSLYNVFGYVADLGLASSLSLAGSGSGPRPHTCIVSQSSEYYTNSQPEFRILYQQSVRVQNNIPTVSQSSEYYTNSYPEFRILYQQSARVLNIIQTGSQSSEYYTNSQPEFRVIYSINIQPVFKIL